MRLYFGKSHTVVETQLSSGHGYTGITTAKEIHAGDPVSLFTEDDRLVMGAVKEDEEPIEYCFFCKEFGLYGYKDKGGLSAKISVIFCDDGMMFVTLKEGTMVLNYENNLLQPVAGSDESYPEVDPNTIYWVSADTLLAHRKYFGTSAQQLLTQDFEYVFTLQGGIHKGLSSFKLLKHQEEYIDISRGYVATFEEAEARKEKSREANHLIQLSLQDSQGSGGLDLDVGDYDDDYDDNDEDDEFDY